MGELMNQVDIDILAEKIAIRLQPPGRWLKLKQAATYSNLGQKVLVSLAKKEIIVGFKDQHLKTKPWIFDRKSLDAYRERQAMTGRSSAPSDEDKKVVDRICDSLGI
jgi:hypothetical protein